MKVWSGSWQTLLTFSRLRRRFVHRCGQSTGGHDFCRTNLKVQLQRLKNFMKKLHARFFESAEQDIPTDTRPLDYWSSEIDFIARVYEWLENHPRGKVEIVLF